jgi:hypothetical protein
MPPQWTTNAHLTAPAAGDAILTPSGSSMGNSAWCEIEDATDGDWVLTDFYITRLLTAVGSGGGARRFEFDIGTGAAGSETVVARFGCQPQLDGLPGSPRQIPVQFPFPLDLFPTGTRIAARLRKPDTPTNQYGIAIGYLKKPIVGNIQTTTSEYAIFPAHEGTGNLPQRGATAPGSYGEADWEELEDAISDPWVITHLTMPPGYNNADGYFDIGTGAAGSEVVQATVAGEWGNGDGPHCIMIPNPLAVIGDGDRVAVRCNMDDNQASTGRRVYFAFGYLVGTP